MMRAMGKNVQEHLLLGHGNRNAWRTFLSHVFTCNINPNYLKRYTGIEAVYYFMFARLTRAWYIGTANTCRMRGLFGVV